jgi:hypothetical protein
MSSFLNFDLNSLNLNIQQVNEFNNIRKLKKSFEVAGENNNNNNNNYYYYYPKNLLAHRPTTALLNLPKTNDFHHSADGTNYITYENGNYKYKIADYPNENSVYIPGTYRELYRTSLVDNEVPLNIKAKFGSKQTSQLLDDQVKVHDTLSRILNRGCFRKSSNNSLMHRQDDAAVGVAERKKSDYTELGAYLRHSFCNGNPKPVKKSTTKLVHNSALSKEFLSDKKNFDSPHRRKKDWLSKKIDFFFVFTYNSKSTH